MFSNLMITKLMMNTTFKDSTFKSIATHSEYSRYFGSLESLRMTQDILLFLTQDD